jgi:hypothetical protein
MQGRNGSNSSRGGLGLDPSNPQIAGAKNVDIMLAERRGVATTGQRP